MHRKRSETCAQTLKGRAHEEQAYALRIAGASYAQIAKQMGYSKAAAHKMIKRWLVRNARATAELAKEVQRMELDRLDAMFLGLWEKARRGDEKATTAAIKIMERRSFYLGLGAPTRSIADVTTHGNNDSEKILAGIKALAGKCRRPEDGGSGDGDRKT